ncbi:MAG: MarR family transcriptional regulator [Myxococcota bacterium]
MRRDLSKPRVDPRDLRDAVRRLIVAHAALDDARRPCGTPLTAPHAWALLELREHGAMTVTSLSERLNIDRTNVSRLCTRMESLGEIRSHAHPRDGRARLIKLSTKGTRLAAKVDASSTGHFLEVLDELPSDPADVVCALEALVDAMSARDAARGKESA